MLSRSRTDQFVNDGFIVIRQLLADDEIGFYIERLKYSLFVAYGVENSHFQHHWHYYLNMRTDLGHSAVRPERADRLRAANLLAIEPPSDLKVTDAWMPSPTYTYVSRRVK